MLLFPFPFLTNDQKEGGKKPNSPSPGKGNTTSLSWALEVYKTRARVTP
jgi:hypothetical protein